MSITKDLIKDIKSSYGHCANLELNGRNLIIRHKRNRDTIYTFPNGNKFMLVPQSLHSKVWEWINS